VVILAWHRENAKRFLRLSTSSRDSHDRPQTDAVWSAGLLCRNRLRAGSDRMHLTEQPSMAASAADSWKPAGRLSDARPASSPSSALCNEKVVASGHNITVSIGLLEPILFLESFERNNPESRKTVMLRGHLRLNLSKPSKIKKVYLQFRGTAVSCWPEGGTRLFARTISFPFSSALLPAHTYSYR
jgi:hypothetical protein